MRKLHQVCLSILLISLAVSVRGSSFPFLPQHHHAPRHYHTQQSIFDLYTCDTIFDRLKGYQVPST